MAWKDIKNFVQKGFRGFDSPIDGNTVPFNPISGRHFFSVVPAGPAMYYDLNEAGKYINAYNACSPLKAIINRRAQMFTNGEIQVVNKRTEKERKRGEEVKSITTLLERPNILQSWAQFWAQLNVYTDLFGYCPVFKSMPVGMEKRTDTPPTAIWCIPPQILEIKFTTKWREQTKLSGIIESYKIVDEETFLPFNQVQLILDNAIGTTKLDQNGSFVIPDSRVKGNEMQISNLVAISKAVNTLVTKKGALGIFSNGAKDNIGHIPMSEEERTRVQTEFRRYGMTGQEFQFIITDANLNWQSTTFPIKDFDFPGLEQSAFSDLCNALGMYEYILSGKNSRGTTFSNLKEAKQAQYQDYIIPEGEARLQQLSGFIIPENLQSYLWIDFSNVEALQESLKEKADGLAALGNAYKVFWELGLLTRNQILTEMDRDPVTDTRRDDFDKYIFELQAVNNGQTEQGNGGTPQNGQTQ